MSDFDDWLSKNHPSTWPVVLRNGKEYLAADVQDLKAAYNAGMERAVEIVVEPIELQAGKEKKNLILAIAAEAISKAIK